MKCITGKQVKSLKKTAAVFIICTFTVNAILPPAVLAQAGNQLQLPPAGMMVNPSPAFTPVMVKGISVDPENPLHFDFIVDTGHAGLKGEELRAESAKLIKYFLASLTVPENELWVNLSPYEKDRIIAEGFGVTEMGRDLLVQDYLLKQLTASLIHPDKELGKEFWSRVREKAYRSFGTTEIPTDSFNKVWIIPDRAIVYEHANTAFIVESHLKVMLDADYAALAQSTVADRPDQSQLSSLQSQILRDVVIPEIEKEVNEGKTFANLRQIYHSLILATWYKVGLKNSILGQVYVDQNKVRGVDIEDKDAKEKIYQQYVKAFETGVYNFIKEDYDPVSQELIPRKYFSGGFHTADKDGAQLAQVIQRDLIKGDVSRLSDSVRQTVARASRPVGDFTTISWTAVETSDDRPSTDISADEAMITNGLTLSEPEQWARKRINGARVNGVTPEQIEEILQIAEKDLGPTSTRLSAIKARANLHRSADVRPLGEPYFTPELQEKVRRLQMLEAYWTTTDLTKSRLMQQSTNPLYRNLTALRMMISEISQLPILELMTSEYAYKLPRVSMSDLHDGDLFIWRRGFFQENAPQKDPDIMFVFPLTEHTERYKMALADKQVVLIAASKATREKLGLPDQAMIATAPQVRAALDRASQLMESVRGNNSVPLSFALTEMLPYKSEATPRLAGLIYLLEHDRPLFERIVRKIIVRSIDKDLSRNRLLTDTFSLVQTDGHLGHRVRDLFWSAVVPNKRVDAEIFAERVLPLAERYKRNLPLTEQDEEDLQYLLRNIGGFFSPTESADKAMVAGRLFPTLPADGLASRYRVEIMMDVVDLTQRRVGAEEDNSISTAVLINANVPGEKGLIQLTWRRTTTVADVEEALRNADLPLDAAMAAKRVLVVDDQEAMRYLSRRLLTRAGYDVTIVSDIDAAKDALAGGNFDLVLSDIRDRGNIETGFELADFVIATYPHVRVKLMSAEYTGAPSQAVVDSGRYFGILPKPFSLDAFRSAVAEVIGPAEDKAMLAGLNEEERSRVQTLSAEFPLKVVAETAKQLTQLYLRGALKEVQDILAKDIPNEMKFQEISYIFTNLYQKTAKEEIEEIIALLARKSGSQELSAAEIKKMSAAIKDTADAIAKRIFERTAQELKIILMVRVSEGFGRDEVAESLKANEVIVPAELRGSIDQIYNAINEGKAYFRAADGQVYPIINAIIDVIEGTNMFVTNSGNKSVDEIEDFESGSTSVIVTGPGVADLGNAPDGYVGQFYTNLGEHAEEFKARRVQINGHAFSMRDPELYAAYPEKIIEYLRFLAEIRGQQLEEIKEEIVVMDRNRERQFLDVLAGLQEQIPGLRVTTIQDGTVAHGLKAAMTPEDFERITGRPFGLHKTVITIGGSAEGFMNLAIVGGLRSKGAVGGLRVYSAKMNKDSAGVEVQDHSQRYAFTQEERADISNLRDDATKILTGNKLFTENDVNRDVAGSFSFISTNGVFSQPGVDQESETYPVRVLNIRAIDGVAEIAMDLAMVATVITPTSFEFFGLGQTSIDAAGSREIYEHLIKQGVLRILEGDATGFSPTASAEVAAALPNNSKDLSLPEKFTGLEFIVHSTLSQVQRAAERQGQRAGDVAMMGISLNVLEAEIREALEETSVANVTYNDLPLSIDGRPEKDIAARVAGALADAGVGPTTQFEYGVDFEANPVGIDIWTADEAMFARNREGQMKRSPDPRATADFSKKLYADKNAATRAEGAANGWVPKAPAKRTNGTPVGGIDLNPALLNLQIKRDGYGVPLPVEMQPIRQMHIDGFVPVIINIVPLNNVPMLLGIADEFPETPTEQARDLEDIVVPALSQSKWTVREEEI